MQKSFLKSRFFKLPEHRRFDMIPRYYDEQSERMENKRKEVAKKMGLEENDENLQRKLRIREKFKSQSNRSSLIGKAFWPNIRLIIIFFILLGLFYYVFINLDVILSTITDSDHN